MSRDFLQVFRQMLVPVTMIDNSVSPGHAPEHGRCLAPCALRRFAYDLPLACGWHGPNSHPQPNGGSCRWCLNCCVTIVTVQPLRTYGCSEKSITGFAGSLAGSTLTAFKMIPSPP